MAAPEQQEPIAVIGMACRFPGGSSSPSKLWDLIRNPRDLSERVPPSRFDSTAYFHPNGSYHGATDSRDAYFLEEDVALFDNAFFNIQPAEAEAIDPQQRLLMETVYDSVCAGGQTIQGLRGSNTAVYVGMMCDDWAQLINRDWEATQTYAATGESRAIISNRVSYFFDWHGPSMTIDTACSSSLVAVHQAVTALRSGECPVAVAAGANLILGPGMWIAESKLHMLSPTGSSKMWDASADGYARGEGIAAVVLKKLSDAIRDGDPIDCVIRGTGVNQDGRTPGLTMPNNAAQAELIRDTYLRSGLDICDPKDRPQFFHAHGTGTQAGDPQEAQAISSSFFADGTKSSNKLLVGSIKTVIGYVQGSAGLASLISTALALQHAMIPPNLHFANLSPRVAPFYDNLEIPTSARPWPEPVAGQPRRASVNSFGFGGTNAHAILESYEPAEAVRHDEDSAAVPGFTPLTVSAATSAALRVMLSDLKAYLEGNPDTNIRDLAYTLQARRSTLAYRTSIICGNVDEAISRIDGLLSDDAAGSENGLTTRRLDVPAPRILGVFTGQGAQWPRMGARLIEQSSYAAGRVAELDRALANLPEGDRPNWSLPDELLAEPKVSRLSEAAISQPACTAVQIVLVDLLRAANVELSGVVGHSSGEIGAAYAAGFLSATDALYIAYYRGLHAHLAGSQGGDTRGAMMAVGTDYEDALDLCELDDFDGRLQVAARNSSNSVTLSGDEDAVDEAEAIFKDENKFARRLRVDTAYHSQHMKPCAVPYLEALARSNITVLQGNGTPWFSSVVEGQTMTKERIQKSQYWVDNMQNTVLFAPAVEAALAEAGPFDMAIEFGPHPALKGPCLDTVQGTTGKKIPYTGLLGRNKDDVDELASALGYIWTHLGAAAVDFDGFEKQMSGIEHAKRFVADLPTYPFEHVRPFYALTRHSGGCRNAHAPPHPLLGRRNVETETDSEVSWRQLLRTSEISWLQGHQLQGQAVFPAMGYVAAAIEAAAAVAGPDRQIGLFTLDDVVIGRALTFGDDDDAGVESKVTMYIDGFTDHELRGRITCHSGLPLDGATPLTLNFSANVTVAFHEPEPDTLPPSRTSGFNLVHADAERLYSQFTSLGYNYNTPFTGVREIHRKMDFATGEVVDESGDDWEDQLLIHPGFLDSALQTGFAAYCHPHDQRLWALHIPTSIRSVVVNPYFLSRGDAGRNRRFQYQATTRTTPDVPMVVDVDLFAGGEDQAHPFVQFDSVGVKPFAAATARDDACVFSRPEYQPIEPNAATIMEEDEEALLAEKSAALSAAERMGFFYLRNLHEAITPSEKAAALPHYQLLLERIARLVSIVSEGAHPTVPSDAVNDSMAFIRSLIARNHSSVFVKLLEIVGRHLEDEIRSGGSMLEHLSQNGLLDRFYEELTGQGTSQGRVLVQLAYRYPRMNILEIGAGSGAATAGVLSALDDAFETYTYTDVSDKLFERAQDRLQKYSARMVFSKYDMERPPAEQGYAEGTYDVVLAAAALHSSTDLDAMMDNARRLLKPGGYLIVGDVIRNDLLSINAIMGSLPEWWACAIKGDGSRSDGPCLSLDQWDALARRHNFSGIDSHTPVLSDLQYYSVFVCQAVDDRVRSLRDPLETFAPDPPPTRRGQLVVVGGRKAATGKLIDETCKLLGARYESITKVDSLEELNRRGLETGSSVLSLTELDQQFMEHRSPAKLESLKTLWRHGRTILYVTRGARSSNPFSGMLMGLSRVARFEYPNINLQLLDFDAASEPTPAILAEWLVRLELGCQWSRDEEDVNLLWTMEPEVYYTDNGLALIPRILPVREANRRYNTYRRTIREEVDPREETVVLEAAQGGKVFELCTTSPLRVLPAPLTETTRTLRVTHSLLQAVRIPGAGFLGICAGVDTETGENLVALLDSPTESRVRAGWTAHASENIPTALGLGAMAAVFVAQSILEAVPRSGVVLVHEADGILKEALELEAATNGVRVIFTTAVKSAAKATTQSDGLSSETIYVHQKLPVRLVQRLLPRQVLLFVNLAPACASACLLAHCLPPNTPTRAAADFLSAQHQVDPDVVAEEVGQTLQEVLRTVSTRMQRRATSRRESTTTTPVIPLQSVTGLPITHPRLSVVDWSTPSVQVRLRPIDHGAIFRGDATYLLFGLAGDLGQSLCAWMVAHGARHIMIGSRRPRVDERFIESLASQGAAIKCMSVDLTQRESLHACYDTIRAEMPPVAGVVNGALVLADALFDDLEFDSLDRTCQPKVEGSLLLDELFYDAPLDFFILFTSAVCVSGNTGQSAYIMANTFMASLVAQRRDVRGVAASDVALAAMSGLGHFEHSESLSKDHFSRMGYRDSSEQDMHRLFAEAILTGRPENAGRISTQIASGLSPVRRSPTIQAQLREDPRFGHFMLPDASALDRQGGGDGAGGGKTARPRVRLAAVRSRAEARSIVQDAFVKRLKRVLMIPQDETLNVNITFVEQGLDSIMAVEVRTWFLSELEVDLPVLKVLGAGSTVDTLVDEVMGRIPASILDWEKLGDGHGSEVQSTPAVTEASPAEGPVKPPSEADSSISPSTPLSQESDASISTSTSQSLSSLPPVPVKAVEDEKKTMLGPAPESRKRIVDLSSEHVEQMTYGQKRFWFLTHYLDDPTTFNIAFMAKLSGRIRANDLARAVEAVAQRHEALRTRFFWSDDDEKLPMQGILSKPLVRLETAKVASEAEATRELEAMRDYKWDLGDWVSVRLRLLSLSDTEHYMIMGTHHISLDGHSFTVMMADIDRAYSQPGQSIPRLPQASQARAFGAGQLLAYECGEYKSAIESYRHMFPPEDLVRPIELFSFARTQVRPPLDRYETHIAQRVLDHRIVAKLNQLARGRRATSFHAYLAALQSLLLRLLPADTTDKVFIGMADANRLDSNFMGAVGNLLNVLPLRFDRARRQTFGEAITAARDKAYSALENSALPYDLLLDELAVPRSNMWAPIFQVFIDYRLIPIPAEQRTWAGCRVSEETWHTARSGYDVVLEVVEDQKNTSLRVHVQKGIYNANAAELLLSSYINILTQVAKQGDAIDTNMLDKWDGADVRKALDIGRGLYQPSHRMKASLTKGTSNTGRDMCLEWPATVAHRIDQVIAQNPNSIALKDGHGNALAYAAMDLRVESIAHALREQLPTSDEQPVIGVFQMPTTDFICSLLAIHRVGAIYLPLDLRIGTARLRKYVNGAQPRAILTDNETSSLTGEVGVHDTATVINVSDLPAKMEQQQPGSAREEAAAKPDQTAYIIFTSGSTGEAKGIVVTHAGLRANLEGYHREWAIDGLASVMLQQAAFSFDASLLQIYAPLTTGGCLFVVPADARGDPHEVTRLMAEHGVTMTQATPSEYDMWFRSAPENVRRCTSWKAAWFGGERAAPGLLDGFRRACEALPNLRVFTSYGPTECTISSMKGEADVRDPSLAVPVPGRVLPNYAAYIVDEDMQPVPVGVPGEIVLGGAGVGRNEYLGRPDLTAEAFKPDPFVAQLELEGDGGARMYRTGDYGRLDGNGLLAIEGRIAGDTQVKLRGFRIELAEIERVMIQEGAGSLTHAVVTLQSHGDREDFLAAHVVLDGRSRLEGTKVIDSLRARLPLCIPQYMCPSVVVVLDDVPLTAHAKVDRKAVQAMPLPVLLEEEEAVLEEEQHFTPTERRLACLWTRLLPPHAPLTRRSDFFLAGGSSLLLVRLQAAIKVDFGDAPRLSRLMSAPGLASMAALLDSLKPVVNWDHEMALDSLDQVFTQPRRVRRRSNDLHVLVTGATGHLGKRIVARLAGNENISRIVCLVRPAQGRDLATLFSGVVWGEKVHVVPADLPSLPDDAELSEIDTVLHCASDRTFWDGYSAAKPVNVDTVKALVRLCLANGANLHVLSSGAVSEYEADGDITGSDGSLPLPSPDDGYVSSKWVAERYLAKAARLAGLHVTVHRPTQVGGADAHTGPEQDVTETEAAMVQAMLLVTPRLGIQPDFAHLGGWLDIAPIEDVAGVVAASVAAEPEPEVLGSKALHIVNLPGTSRVRTDALALHTRKLLEDPRNEAVRKLPTVSGLHFVGVAKKAGLFGWVLTAQEIVVKDEKGQKIVTRR
ncbi:hypothetical protein NLU13_9652 [Sarocladium strictum]|uniref:Uncharacterized protein n=1 Tax=Sarocladium strictum TaxID=5046 RepID=A0AA39GB01_SARSR|nr:hypothetical protein NLU13_9652 [Sarocladium strictum]